MCWLVLVGLAKLLRYLFSASLGIFLFFDFLFLIGSFGVVFPVLVRGVGMVFYVVDGVFFSRFVDVVICFASLLVAFSLFVYFMRRRLDVVGSVVLVLLVIPLFFYVFGFGFVAFVVGFAGGVVALLYGWRRGFCGFSIAVLVWLSVLSAVSLVSCVRWVLNGFDGAVPLSDVGWCASLLDLQLTYGLFYPVLPRVFAIFLAAWVLRLLSFSCEGWFARLLGGSSPQYPRRVGFALLCLALVAVVFVCVYPYLPALNPSWHLVGVDVVNPNGYYSGAVSYLSMGVGELFDVFVRSDRTLYLVFQHAVVLASGSPDLGIRLLPSLLGLLLVLSVYFLVSVGSGEGVLAVFSALFSAFSFQVTAGVNAGYYANWLALVEVNIFFALLIKALRSRLMIYVALSTLASISILFTHPATWLVTMGSLVLFGLLGFVRRLFGYGGEVLSRYEFVLLTVVAACNVAADLVRGLLIRGYEATQVADVTLRLFSSDYVLWVFDHLRETFTFFLGGALANPIIVVLSILGVFAVARCKGWFECCVVALAVVPSLAVLFTSSAGGAFLQARFIYLIPFQILCGLGLAPLTKVVSRLVDDRRLSRILAILLCLFVFLPLFGYALRVVGTLYPILA